MTVRAKLWDCGGFWRPKEGSVQCDICRTCATGVRFEFNGSETEDVYLPDGWERIDEGCDVCPRCLPETLEKRIRQAIHAETGGRDLKFDRGGPDLAWLLAKALQPVIDDIRRPLRPRSGARIRGDEE